MVGTFTPPGVPEHRSICFERIQDVIAAEGAGIAEAAELAVAGIRQLHRFGPAVATRFLTLACPGALVSVNGPSAAGLGAFAGMDPDENYLASEYSTLLEKVHGQEWWHAPEPVNPRDREIWRCRAALVDARVYIPGHKP